MATPRTICAILMMSLMVFSCMASPPFSEGGVVFGFSLLETAPVGLDELQGVCDELVGAFRDPLVGLPDMSVEGSDDGNPGTLVKAPRCDVCELLEADHTDPTGLLLGAVKGDVEACDGISLRTVKHFGVRTKVPCQNALVEHDVLLSERKFGQFKNILEFSMIYIYRKARYPGTWGRKGWQRRSSLTGINRDLIQ